MSSPLSSYHHKRDFSVTSEPKGKTGKPKTRRLAFVIQKHGARRLHYDFRLELDGVMKSWAVTRGPSYDPADKRLAVHVEDHPLEYNRFEGVIPDKQYGAGPVMIWDNGEWIPEGDPHQDLKKGHLTFQLHGQRMHGRWHLVRMNSTDKRDNWLLIKGEDEFILKGTSNQHFLEQENTSIVSNLTLDEIRAGAKGNASDDAHRKTKKMQTTGIDTSAATSLLKKYPRPELATLVEFPPAGSDWLHEIKYDGYRIMAFLENGKVRLRTRGEKDWTHKFPGIAKQLAQIKVSNAVLDGELGVLNDRGATSFAALQDALSRHDSSQVQGWFFDLLHLNDDDRTQTPLIERKAALKKILNNKALTMVHYSDHLESSPHLLKKACSIGAEGLVSKRKDSAYQFRRTKEWLKSKCGQAQEFVIGGFMPAKDGSESIASLLLGYYQDGKFRYAGKVGTGFGAELARQIYRQLQPLRLSRPPFSGKVEKSVRPHVWVKPKLLCEVAFWEWTADQRIRHASFKGLREDIAPKSVRLEIPDQLPNRIIHSSTENDFTVEGITITHPEREVFPGSGISKGDIARYYAKVLPFMLPFLKNRLISLVRCTDTIEGECFFQRNPMRGMGPDLRGKTITHQGKKHNYFYIDNAAGVLELVQMGTIEFHVWQSRVQMIDKPEQIIFDLDPGEHVPFDAIKLAAEDVRRRLQQLGLESFPRLSGGKGIHVAVPLKPNHGWDGIKRFCRRFAQHMERDAPDAYVATMNKSQRRGKIFIDYLRNDFSSTAIAPYSLRARKGAPVAVPLSWKQLDGIDSSQAFNIFTIDALLTPAHEQMNKRYLDMHQSIKI
ncbi:MAG: DNA ligase D [Nitrosomonas sp.]|nr:DNA ligase D [Nitrosomonas sp.]